MEMAIILFGLLSIGCTWTLFITIGTYNRKIAEVHKALANMHIKVMEMESYINVEKKRTIQTNSSNPRVKKEIIYKVPNKITGDLTMTHKGQSALVKAVLDVKDTK